MSAFGRLCKAEFHPLVATVSVVGVCLVFKGVTLLFSHRLRARLLVGLNSLEKDMVHLFVHHRWSHGPNLFPQCVKVETFLRLAKIAYTVHFTSDASLSPTSRLPFIVYNGVIVGDAELCIKFLKETFKVTMDDGLTPEDHAIGHITRRMVETSLNYGLQRSILVDRPEVMQQMFVKEYLVDPRPARRLVNTMRRQVAKILNAVGYNTLSKEQYPQEFLCEVQSLETLLSTKPFLLGNSPTTYDCTVYGWLHVAREMGPHGLAIRYLVKSKVLNDYIMRMMKLAFPDIRELGTSAESQKFTPYEQR
ncbi:hypothetical protein TraAM80_06846 [Trypanosoma rangeli]|uniref:Thioredoxin-like fold domain-containing protein n=1 Tax=Trypanosoma rangeli TaxID=5698 RepID=A0A422N8G9_TRYRA|nr:uncharacterized protein TraAM80_06846 [Trypanosoma rangeli]RNF01760.1 hypothetical protein TraAM80_06846 [Trypanosoma rangeli]|eukprot:RNF01760.1 hypothetical protein TraAM80_06846 [Trypanosoma rangeli]